MHSLEGDMPNHTVSDYWSAEGGWKLGMFRKFLPKSTLMRLASPIVSNADMEEDHPGWNQTQTRLFSMKFAYELKSGRDE